MRGQITLEYMLLSLVVLALLSISITALLNIKDNSDEAMNIVFFKSSARDIHNAVEAVCALGDGNSREVTLKHEVEIDYMGGYLEYYADGMPSTLKYETKCDVYLAETSFRGKVTVSNDDGTVEIRNA
jgi:uncharacterized protein (UPF0333 family)